MSSYGWIHLRGADPQTVRAALCEPAELEPQGGWVRVVVPQAPALETFYADLDRFARTAQALSRKLRTVALAALNVVDELLLLWAYRSGRLVFEYDSNPMVLGCPVCSYSETTVPAQFSEAEELARLLGRPEVARELKSWLVRRRGLGFLTESQRHRHLLELLGLTHSSAPVAVT